MKRILLTFFLLLATCLTNEVHSSQTRINRPRCVAITQKGTQCKNKAIEGSRYCHVHQSNNPGVQRCKAMTKSGSQCSRAAKKSGYCSQHYKSLIQRKR